MFWVVGEKEKEVKVDDTRNQHADISPNPNPKNPPNP